MNAFRDFLGGGVIVLGALAGCYTGSDSASFAPSGSSGATTTTTDGTVPNDAATGVPCDVADVLARTCVRCHGTPLAGGAPNRLVTYDDLVGPSKSDPGRSMLEVSIERMGDTKKPMPPDAVAPASDTAVFAAWLAAKSPKGACSTGPSTDPKPPPPPNSDYDTPTVCTSKTKWTKGNRGSSSMHPGGACVACHESDEGPLYTIAGTVYPTAHEPDDCNGTSGAKIVVTDASNRSYTITPNAVGNFVLSTKLTMPYRAKVVVGTKVREMLGPQTNGDCNVCHTEAGTQKAPGRVMTP